MEHWRDFLELDNLKIEHTSKMIGSQSTDNLSKKKKKLNFAMFVLTIESTVQMGSFFSQHIAFKQVKNGISCAPTNSLIKRIP